ncbi:MFS transporter [Heyndrickxia camelliae]|uniref:MFS transporter n=1 Tax=Heyndrickxia camelliae TaxID=1707093 RepID=UPI001F43F28A|nr:MFS transporter [Heyndrickxia camelliae]
METQIAHLQHQEAPSTYVKRNMSFIVCTSAIGSIAEAIYTLCVSWYVLDRTGSAFLTSAIAAISFIVNVFAGPFIGVLVDRFNPKSAMKKAYIVMALIGVALALSYIFFRDYIVFSVMVMVIVNDVAQAFIFPSQNRLLPILIGKDRIAIVSGYMSSASNTAGLLGNAVAGMLLSLIGFVGVMLTHSALFILAAVLVKWLVLPKYETKEKQQHQGKRQFWTEFKEGAKILRGHNALLALTFMNMGTNIVSIGYLYMVILKTQYGATSSQYGFFEATAVMVSIVTGLFVGKIVKKFKPVVILTGARIISSSLYDSIMNWKLFNNRIYFICNPNTLWYFPSGCIRNTINHVS